MSVIQVEQVWKVFRKPQKDPGMRGTVTTLLRPCYQTNATVAQLRFVLELGETVGHMGVNGVGKP